MDDHMDMHFRKSKEKRISQSRPWYAVAKVRLAVFSKYFGKV